MSSTKQDEWLYEISPKRSLLDINFAEIWRYRDLLLLFVKRDIITVYKQTILGPLWFLIQPLMTSSIQFLVFMKIAEIPTDGIPPFLFLVAGNTLWGYFSECFNKTSNTFTANQGIYGKVYFPRVISPISVTISNLMKFGIQFCFFIILAIYFYVKGFEVHPNWMVILLPVLLLLMALISLGAGMIISSMTTKYRDVTYLVGFGVSLFMYVTPVVYPTSLALEKVPERYQFLVYANPLTTIMEMFRYAFLGSGSFTIAGVVYTSVFSVVIFLLGLMVFNKTEKSFIDTV